MKPLSEENPRRVKYIFRTTVEFSCQTHGFELRSGLGGALATLATLA